MVSIFIRIVVPVLVILAVSEISRRMPRLGALLLTLPSVSILAFTMSWYRDQDLKSLSMMARETLVLVPLGLPFFVPLAFAEQLGLSFWPTIWLGILLASLSIGLWLAFGPKMT